MEKYVLEEMASQEAILKIKMQSEMRKKEGEEKKETNGRGTNEKIHG